VFVGGCIGALARAGLTRALPSGDGFPWATMTANLVGTALLAWFATRLQERLPPSTYRRPLLGTGLCGALTTFSTMQIELIRLGRDGNGALAAGYLAVTLVGGTALMLAVTRLVRRAQIR
jgi:CrcB protein